MNERLKPSDRGLARTRLLSLLPALALSLTPANADAASGKCPDTALTGSKWVTLGTAGGPLPRLNRSQPANALVVNGSVYLFDTGDGVLRQMRAAGLSLGEVRAVFLTHHHVDHNADLGAVLVTRWVLQHHQPIMIWGPRGTRSMVGKLFEANLGTERAPVNPGIATPRLASTATGKDIPPAADGPVIIYRDQNIAVTAVRNGHYHFDRGSAADRFSRSYSYRIEAPGRVIVFTGDTGPSEKLTKLARGADLLVSEVIDLEGVRAMIDTLPQIPTMRREALMKHIEAGHLTSAAVGRLAQSAGVRCLVLTHVAPGQDNETNTSVYLDDARAYFSGPVVLADDLSAF
ncbi:MAG: MBL fold metallo-hydrolase [Sphingomicrobium sp.]